MRIAVVSDIHGNQYALNAIVADLRVCSPDLVIQGGDLVGNGSSNAEVVEIVAALGWPGVYGNTDEMLWNAQGLSEFTLQQLTAEHLAYLRALPESQSLGGVAVVHATPGNAWSAPQPTATDDELLNAYGSLGANTVVFGHVHVPFIRQVENMTIANSGAVSLSYDGDARAAYLLIDQGVSTIRRVAYEVEPECRQLIRCRHPHGDWIAAMLRAGRFLPFASR
jgi:putative phosphoesterase